MEAGLEVVPNMAQSDSSVWSGNGGMSNSAYESASVLSLPHYTSRDGARSSEASRDHAKFLWVFLPLVLLFFVLV